MTSSAALDASPPPAGAPLVVITGSTGVGKTSTAVDLCQQLGGELVGVDSVQVYRGLDIGSCKPDAAQLKGVAHHMLDLLEPTDQLSAASYARLADRAIEEVRQRGKLPVVVGGTGLWLRALLRGLVDVPPVDPELRQALEDRWEREGAQAMHAELLGCDPVSAAAIHPNDKLRVVRALEVHSQTGRAMGDLRAEHQLGAPRYPTVGIHLELPTEVWEHQVSERMEGMFERGWLAEVEGLVAQHGSEAPALRSVGYRQLVEHLAQRGDLEGAKRAVLKATRVYARRQRNWFRTDPCVDVRLTPAEVQQPEQRDWLQQRLAQAITRS